MTPLTLTLTGPLGTVNSPPWHPALGKQRHQHSLPGSVAFSGNEKEEGALEKVRVQILPKEEEKEEEEEDED